MTHRLTDKGDALRLSATGYIGLTTLYVYLISIAAPRVKGGEGRAKTVAKAILM